MCKPKLNLFIEYKGFFKKELMKVTDITNEMEQWIQQDKKSIQSLNFNNSVYDFVIDYNNRHIGNAIALAQCIYRHEDYHELHIVIYKCFESITFTRSIDM